MAQTAQKLLKSLDTLLEDERKALLAGELDSMTGFVDRKTKMIDALSEMSDVPRDMVIPLHKKIVRNQTLITSALEGVQAVAARLTEMREIRRSLQTYDRSGAIRDLGGQVSRQVEKRA